MPAVTVDDITHLPRVAAPSIAPLVPRPVDEVSTAPRTLEGEGFPVRRAFAGIELPLLDPFLHLDQLGEALADPARAAGPKGTPWHPHRGFETVTYLLDGALHHEDSAGGRGVLRDGGTQWMTAGRGILHHEAPPDEPGAGDRFHGLQLWVNLPRTQKWVPPRYDELGAGRVALLASPDGGALIRLLAGELAGHRGPGVTYTPVTLVHATLSPGARVELPWRPDFNALAYVLGGRGAAGVERRPLRGGQLAVFGPGELVALEASRVQDARARELEVVLLGGRPLREPIAWMGPFVMNTDAELRQAIVDFRAGRLGHAPTASGPVALSTDAALD